ncbi:MAG: hypothetical protein VX681_14630 [Myxococcota bacterium]|nr:hypothetical protein [Myxococcota bacterium]
MLFFTKDERAGIQLPTPERFCCDVPYPFNTLGDASDPNRPGGPVLPSFNGRDQFFNQKRDDPLSPRIANPAQPPTGRIVRGNYFPGDPPARVGIPQYDAHPASTERKYQWLQFDDFTESSVTQFTNLGLEIGRQTTPTRLRPFLASWVYDTEEDSLTVADHALGPMLAERAQTMGKGRLAFGFSYQSTSWTRLNGRKLDSLDFRIDHKDVGRPGINGGEPDGVLTGQETDFIIVDVDVSLDQSHLDFYFEYGVTNNFDVSIAVPIVQTAMELRAYANAVSQADPNDPAIDLREPGLDFSFSNPALFPQGGNGFPVYDPSQDPFQENGVWGVLHSRRIHSFCRDGRTIVSLTNVPGSSGKECPGQGQPTIAGDPSLGVPAIPAQGLRANPFQGIVDSKDGKAIGLGDIRFRAKWHAIEGAGLVPDLSWVSEVRPPSGKQEDFQGSGALSTSNYLVTTWAWGPVRPHMNVGLEISTGPDWQDATEWVFGFEWLMFDWLSLSFEQMGRVPFGTAVARRYEYGGGVKLVPAPGAVLYFDFIRPINQNDGLTADLTWRAGGQILF